MERRGSNTWLVAVLAVAVGFLAALLIFGSDDDNDNASTTSSTETTVATTSTDDTSTTETTTTGQQATPQSPSASVSGCIELWNQPNNRGAQVALVNLASQQPVRIHVGNTSDVPPECLITVVANNGDAYTFTEGGGATYPFAPGAARASSDSLPAAQKTANALDESDGTLKPR